MGGIGLSEMKTRRYKTWGEPFRAAKARGLDPGYAAYIADQWEKRHFKKKPGNKSVK